MEEKLTKHEKTTLEILIRNEIEQGGYPCKIDELKSILCKISAMETEGNI